LLLTPGSDHLFDRAFIGFEGNGNVVVSPVADATALQAMGIETHRTMDVGSFNARQKRFLQFHREFVLLKSNRTP
jgi:hypothetical protein